MFARDNPHPRAYGCAITPGPHKLDLDPVLFVSSVIPKERWQIVHIQDQRIHIAIVVIISERCASTGKVLSYAGAHLRRNIPEVSIAEIFVDQARILESLI